MMFSVYYAECRPTDWWRADKKIGKFYSIELDFVELFLHPNNCVSVFKLGCGLRGEVMPLVSGSREVGRLSVM